MKTINLNTLLFAINIVKINKEGKATLKFGYSKMDKNGKPIAWTHNLLKDVTITSRIRAKLNDPDNTKYLLNKTYSSRNNSKDFLSNPFSLVKTKLGYILKGVEQDGLKRYRQDLPDGTFAEKIIWFNKSSDKYYRYINKSMKLA